MPLRLSVDAEPLRKWTTQELVKAASLAGVPSNTIRRALTRGSLTTILADRIACGLGSHVDLIWPDFPTWTSSAEFGKGRKCGA